MSERTAASAADFSSGNRSEMDSGDTVSENENAPNKMQHRALTCSRLRCAAVSLAAGLAQQAWNHAHMRLVGFDTNAASRVTTQLAALAAVGAMLLGPAAGTLSDTVGRRPMLACAAVGRSVWRLELLRLGAGGHLVRLHHLPSGKRECVLFYTLDIDPKLSTRLLGTSRLGCCALAC